MEAAKGLSAEDLQLLLNRAQGNAARFCVVLFLSCVSVMQVVVEVQEAGAHKFVSILGFLLGCPGGDGAGGGGAAGELKSSGPAAISHLCFWCGGGGGGAGGWIPQLPPDLGLAASLTCPGADGAGGGGAALKRGFRFGQFNSSHAFCGPMF